MSCLRIISKSYLLQWFETSLHERKYPEGHDLVGKEYFQIRSKSKATADKVFNDFLNENFGKDSWKTFTEQQWLEFAANLKAKIDLFPDKEPEHKGIAEKVSSLFKKNLWLDRSAKSNLIGAIDAGMVVFQSGSNETSQSLLSVESRMFYYTDEDVKEMVNNVTKGQMRPRELPIIRVLLQRTYKDYSPKSNGDPECITCENVSLKRDLKINDLKIPAGSIVVNHKANFYEYDRNGEFWVDFAHASSFGGAWNTYGCVQEERMFAEFPSLGLLDHLSKGNVHPCLNNHAQSVAKNHQSSAYPPDTKPSPFIIYDLKRRCDISQTPYGSAFQKVSEDQVKTLVLDRISDLSSEEKKSVNVIGLAAVDFRSKERGYELEDLQYHFNASYLAYARAKEVNSEAVIHTGAWGCGAFLNNIKMMIALQYLAAKAAGVNITFHRPENTANFLAEESISFIENLLQNGKSIQEILNVLFELTTQDRSSWQRRFQ